MGYGAGMLKGTAEALLQSDEQRQQALKEQTAYRDRQADILQDQMTNAGTKIAQYNDQIKALPENDPNRAALQRNIDQTQKDLQNMARQWRSLWQPHEIPGLIERLKSWFGGKPQQPKPEAPVDVQPWIAGAPPEKPVVNPYTQKYQQLIEAGAAPEQARIAAGIEPKPEELKLEKFGSPFQFGGLTFQRFLDQYGKPHTKIVSSIAHGAGLPSEAGEKLPGELGERMAAERILSDPNSTPSQRTQAQAYLDKLGKSKEGFEEESYEDWLKEHPGGSRVGYLRWKAGLAAQVKQAEEAANLPGVLTERPTGPSKNKIDPKTGMTPNGVYQAALVYATEGRMPSLGMSSTGNIKNARTAVMNTAAALADAAGVDLPTLQADYRANATSLNKIVPLYNATSAFITTATENMDLALAQSPKVARTGSPIANRFIQWANGQALTGNPELTRFETYIYTAAREYAKVTGGAALSAAGLTDSANREAAKLLNAAQIPSAFAAAVDAMKKDMANVVSAQRRQISKISGTIGRFLRVNGPVGNAEEEEGIGAKTQETGKPKTVEEWLKNPE